MNSIKTEPLTESQKSPNSIIPLEIEYKGKTYKGRGYPIQGSCNTSACFELKIVLNGEDLGLIHSDHKGDWFMDNVRDRELVQAIGEEIMLWYE